MSVTFKLQGLSELQNQLKELRDVQLAAKVLARAARRAFKPVLEAAKALVPRDSGDLAESLTITVKRPKGGDAVVVVGIKVGTGKANQARVAAAAFGEAQSRRVPPALRWHFIELGTSELAAQPFLRPALEANAPAVLEALKAELAQGIARVLKKRAKGGGK